MVELKQISFFREGDNIELIKHYAEDETGQKYWIKQVETNMEFEEAIDVLPCRYTYIVTDKKIEIETEDI